MPLSSKLLILASIVISLALLYPGVTQPVLTLQGSIPKSELAEMGITMLAGDDADSQQRQMLAGIASFMGLNQQEGEMEVYHTTRSIWETAEDFAANRNLFVAILIVTFSVVIPSIKLLLQAASLSLEHSSLLVLNSVLSKWSMTDVFVMALLVTYLAGNSSGKMGAQLTMQAHLEPGFYFFLGYCVFSIISGQLMQKCLPGPIAKIPPQ